MVSHCITLTIKSRLVTIFNSNFLLWIPALLSLPPRPWYPLPHLRPPLLPALPPSGEVCSPTFVLSPNCISGSQWNVSPLNLVSIRVVIHPILPQATKQLWLLTSVMASLLLQAIRFTISFFSTLCDLSLPLIAYQLFYLYLCLYFPLPVAIIITHIRFLGLEIMK